MADRHTPGPWSWDAGDIGQDYSVFYCSVTANDTELVIAEVNDRFDRGIGHANACLIAASPEMLDALAEVVAASDAYDESQAASERVFQSVEKARAAIAKAEAK